MSLPFKKVYGCFHSIDEFIYEKLVYFYFFSKAWFDELPDEQVSEARERIEVIDENNNVINNNVDLQ